MFYHFLTQLSYTWMTKTLNVRSRIILVKLYKSIEYSHQYLCIRDTIRRLGRVQVLGQHVRGLKGLNENADNADIFF